MDQGQREPLRVYGSQRAPLRIAHLGRRGRGVVAERRIEPGELVERSPVLVIPHADRAAADPTVVFTYMFMWEHGAVEDLYKHQGRAAIAPPRGAVSPARCWGRGRSPSPRCPLHWSCSPSRLGP